MRLSAHQPAYLPWLGLFHKIASCDLFVILDTVPMSGPDAEEFSNRNRIKSHNGVQWLTVPVKRGLDVPHKDVQILNDRNWQRKHLKAIENAYSKAPFFGEHIPWLRRFFYRQWNNLSDMNVCLMVDLMDCLGIKTQWMRASERDFKGSKSGLILDMCRQLGATSFLFGPNGRSYADVVAFESAGVKVSFQDYQHPVYRQQHGEFTPHLSVIDLLLNHGPESRAILMGEKIVR